MVFSLSILLAGMFVIGSWITSSIKDAVINRTAGVTALYVDSFVSPLVQDVADGGALSESASVELERLMSAGEFSTEIVSFKVWSPEGVILFSPNGDLVGRTYAMDGHLRAAFDGEVVSEISDLTEPENEYESLHWDSLIETYAPVRVEGAEAVLAVAEFYQLPDRLQSEIQTAQRRGWMIVGLATAIMYLLLVGMVRRASGTIRGQRQDLLRTVDELRGALDDNRRLQSRLKRAAARTTTLNEQFLRRVSADIHDGPAQEVSLALLRMEEIREALGGRSNGSDSDLELLNEALGSALSGLRHISRGLRAPRVEDLSVCEAARLAVVEYERLSGDHVRFGCESPDEVSATASVNITVYRVVQESLANSRKHAGPAMREVRLVVEGDLVRLSIMDDGTGFQPGEARTGDGLGLIGMAERVELLGGRFEVTSRPGAGAVVEAELPLEAVLSDG